MITDKPTPEQLDTFLKGLSEEDLIELIVSRAHHDNRVPVEFVSKSNGTRCGIDNDGHKLAIKEQSDRAKKFFDTLGLKPLDPTREGGDNRIMNLLGDNAAAAGLDDKPFRFRSRYFDGPFPHPIVAGLDAGPLGIPQPLTRGDLQLAIEHSRMLRGVQSPRVVPSTERFEKFVKDLPIHELFEVGDLIVNNTAHRGIGSYRSLALEQEERIFHTDLPFIYNEIKSRFKQMTEVK